MTMLRGAPLALVLFLLLYTVKPVFRGNLNIPTGSVSRHHMFFNMGTIGHFSGVSLECPYSFYVIVKDIRHHIYRPSLFGLKSGRKIKEFNIGVSLEDVFYCNNED